jgi:hypothetical protein
MQEQPNYAKIKMTGHKPQIPEQVIWLQAWQEHMRLMNHSITVPTFFAQNIVRPEPENNRNVPNPISRPK